MDNDKQLIEFDKEANIGGFVVSKKISEGACGVVYLVENRTEASPRQKYCAMKVESELLDDGSAIKVECSVLQDLKGEKVVAELVVAGKTDGYQYVVMTLLGPDLNALQAKCSNPSWSKGTWARVGIQCLFDIKIVHDSGWVHRDVKMKNFAVGVGESSRAVHIFDFGMSRPFIQHEDKKQVDDGRTPIEDLIRRRRRLVKMEKERKTFFSKVPREEMMPSALRGGRRPPVFRPPRTKVDPRGTQGLMSTNACKGMDQGRVDDVWSLLYTIVCFFGELPWQADVGRREQSEMTLREVFLWNNQIALTKEQLKQLDDIEAMLKACDFYSHPNYQMIYEFLLSVMNESGVTWETPYDWEQKGGEWEKHVEPLYWFKWQDPGLFFVTDQWCHAVKEKQEARKKN